MEEDEYESLPPSSTMVTHMFAGAAAGVLEHTIMFPVDCVKTRMMALVPDPRATYRSVGDAFVRIVRDEGMRKTVRGINVVLGAAGPAHALYFACYEKVKYSLQLSMPSNPLVPAVAGTFATLLHDAVMNPADVVKQRMQVYQSPYKTCLECARSVAQAEGVKAFYRSYLTQLTMNIPFQSTHFVFYEQCQDYLNAERQYRPGTHVVSGAVAGALAAGLTTPLDVCKTLLNTQERCAVARSQSGANGMAQAARTIYEFHGYAGFFRGMSARVIHQMPSTAISWSVYEFFKYFVTSRKGSASCDGYVSPVQVHAVSPR